MTQSFFAAENQTGRPGKSVLLKTVVQDVADIISGKYDDIPDDFRFMFIGEAKEARGVGPSSLIEQAGVQQATATTAASNPTPPAPNATGSPSTNNQTKPEL